MDSACYPLAFASFSHHRHPGPGPLLLMGWTFSFILWQTHNSFSHLPLSSSFQQAKFKMHQSQHCWLTLFLLTANSSPAAVPPPPRLNPARHVATLCCLHPTHQPQTCWPQQPTSNTTLPRMPDVFPQCIHIHRQEPDKSFKVQTLAMLLLHAEPSNEPMLAPTSK